MTAILFGSISTLSDTSELQRQAYNEAFRAHGLDWNWDRDEYRGLLRSAGGAKRVARYAADRGEGVDADAIHQTKSEIFRRQLGRSDVTPRPGVSDTIGAAKAKGYKVALVTTTAPENVAALVHALDLRTLDLTVDATSVAQRKPEPAAYLYALHALGESAKESIAIEDNEDGVAAARAAGLRCIAFPNENTAAHSFSDASARLDKLTLEDLHVDGAPARI